MSWKFSERGILKLSYKWWRGKLWGRDHLWRGSIRRQDSWVHCQWNRMPYMWLKTWQRDSESLAQGRVLALHCTRSWSNPGPRARMTEMLIMTKWCWRRSEGSGNKVELTETKPGRSWFRDKHVTLSSERQVGWIIVCYFISGELCLIQINPQKYLNLEVIWSVLQFEV